MLAHTHIWAAYPLRGNRTGSVRFAASELVNLFFNLSKISATDAAWNIHFVAAARIGHRKENEMKSKSLLPYEKMREFGIE
jgi:hypothetical protein